MAMDEVLLGVFVTCAIVLTLAVFVLVVRSFVLPQREVTILVNEQRSVPAQTGQKLLAALRDAGIAVPSTCAGVGTCGLCRVRVIGGGGGPLATETARIARRDLRSGTRLACQVTVRDEMSVEVPESLLNVNEFECTVIEARYVSPLIREIVLAPPSDHKFEFEAGAYVQVTAPPYRLEFDDAELPASCVEALAEIGTKNLIARSNKDVTRAYSIASAPCQNERIVLLIRLALPPPDHADAPPGIVSSYLFAIKPGDKVAVSGPYGHFGATQSDREMVVIGGGVGMAPLRSIIHDQLERRRTTRKISFWYGARSCRDLFYEDEFERLAAENSNFTWTAALSDPGPNDEWDGPTGFIHSVVYERYLKAHSAPEDCEYYLCGPPLMMQAVLAMLDECGVDEDAIYFDDFGSSQYGAD